MAGDARELAEAAKQNTVVDALIRVGYFTHGVVYGVIGYLAVLTAISGRGEITDQTGALSAIAEQPYGKVALMIMVVGIIGLVLWGLIRGIADPHRQGKSPQGLISRAGHIITGLSYGAMLIPSLTLISGARKTVEASGEVAEDAATGMLFTPAGPALVGIAGVVMLVIGVVRIHAGIRAKFAESLKSYQMTERQYQVATRLGRIGYMAIGLVFIIIGVLAITAAVRLDPTEIGGLDEALLFLARQPYGPWLLGLVALGLIAYAIYSILGAFWFRIKEL